MLPHPGEGAQTYLDTLAAMPGWRQRRVHLAPGPEPREALRVLPRRLLAVARAAPRADLLHLHGEMASLLCLPLLGLRPSVWTGHGLHLVRRMSDRRRAAAQAGVRAIVAAADVTIAVAQAERRALAGIVGARLVEKVVAIPNGIDAGPPRREQDRRAARAGLGLDDGEVAALYLGRLEERKDPLAAVAAARTAREAGAPVTLLVAGDGPLLADVRAAESPAVRALGRRSDVERLLSAADVFVLPSRREGLSYALLEAMSRGLPAVVTAEPGSAEAVGDTGLVVAPGDVAALANALGRLAGDAGERERLAHAARERAETTFSASEMVRRTREVYERVAAG